nr:immunoglobulin heavy chain junction region [Mus musculus]
CATGGIDWYFDVW